MTILNGGVAKSRDETGAQARSRIVKLVDFLKDYDARKNPPITDISHYGLYLLREEDLPLIDDVVVTGGAEDWMTVPFVELPPRPRVPESVAEYLPPDKEISATVRPVPAAPAGREKSDAVAEDVAERLAAAEEWVSQAWRSWALRYVDAQRAKSFYRNLFDASRTISDDRESYELVWGFGRLRWQSGPIIVNHPLFSVPMESEQGTENQLVVRPAGPLELEMLAVANLPVADRAALGRIRETVSADPFDPWVTEVLADELRGAVRALDHDAVLAGEGQPQPGAPVADTGWVLYVRRRRPDRQGFLDAMRGLYDGGVIPPDALSSIVVDAPSAYAIEEADTGFDELSTAVGGTLAEPLLLPLPSNEEQQRILVLAQTQSGVVVQGPPGTGKSHTIANLVSHYVAYGRRVLVVAEKEQALTVLAEKIPEEIRPLAVSVLGSDQSSRMALEGAIHSIQAGVSALDKQAQDRIIASLVADLAAMDVQIALTTDRLMKARRSETQTLAGGWLAGLDPSPEKAAVWVADNQENLGYISDPIDPAVAAPLTGGELAELVGLVATIGIERARQCAFVLPDLSRIPTAAALTDMFARRRELRESLSNASIEVSDWSLIDKATPDRVAELRAEAIAELSRARAAGVPWLASIARKLGDPLLRQEWVGFDSAVRGEREQILQMRPALAAHDVRIPAVVDAKFADLLQQAHTRLTERGKLGIFANDAKRALEECSVDGAHPVTADQVQLCQIQLRTTALRRTLRQRWINYCQTVGGPDLDPERPEEELGVQLALLGDVLTAGGRWSALRGALATVGISTASAYGTTGLQRAIEVLDLVRLRDEERRLGIRFDQLAHYLAEGAGPGKPSPLWRLLADNLAAGLSQTWQQHREAIQDMVGIAPAALRLTELSDRLGSVAPVWIQKILIDPTKAGEPASLSSAWQWRQLDTWVASIAAGESPAQLQNDLELLCISRRRLVAELVGVRAWRRLADNLGDRQRQALNSYIAATKRYGKTGGKFAARWLAAIRAALNESKDAVPVWIMTTARALTSFRPEKEVPFDVIIVDEASQIGIDALPLLSLARRAIVVGDDKQTSPSAVGMDQANVFELIDSHLSGIHNHRVLFNPTNSLYDLAFQKFPRSVMLREHFRCLPEIIAFSNREIYGDKIEALRDGRPSLGWKALGAVKVIDGFRDRRTDTNVAEANVVVGLIAKMAEDPAYDGMDFGVVCLLAGAQAVLIRAKLFDRLGPRIVTERRIRVGDAANFQGDERDVMIVCTVVATDPNHPTARIGAMTSADAAQRINVAASRARDQMWIVHSVDPERFPANDLRANLIRHCRNPLTNDVAMEGQLAQCDSEFERRVLRRILARGYPRVRSQVRVGNGTHSFRIDLVVEGPESRLAVECDGERWHGEDRWHADRARQEVLERAGWTFQRLRGSAFFRDPERAMEPLWERLTEMGIPVGHDWIDESTSATVSEIRGLEVATKDPSTPVEDLDEVVEPAGDASANAAMEPYEQHTTGLKAPSREVPVPTPPAAVRPSGYRPYPSKRPAQRLRPAAKVPQTQLTQRESGQRPVSAGPLLLPYHRFDGGPFASVSVDHREEIAAGLREVIGVEGPVLAVRAYQLYVVASGARRVGGEVRRILNQVAHSQLRKGDLAFLTDDAMGMIDRTLYLPGTSPVQVRALGGRELIEVPKSEIHELIAALGMSGQTGDGVNRAVLETYGLTRLTARATTFLSSCTKYSWTL
ncbi:MAG: hypothetical protein QOI21_3125 [Actinomycetota bacterium]|nr:hypothetical protein [Actinomycetota bacterium]